MGDPTNVNPDPERMTRALAHAVATLDRAAVAHLGAGSIAGTLLGDTRWPSPGGDLDIFVSEPDARRCVDALVASGWREEGTEQDWLLKVRYDGVLLDVIFRGAGSMYVDDEMLRRAPRRSLNGVELRILPPEDYIVMQAATASVDTQSNWFDALGALRRSEIDWEYLLRRCGGHAERVAALLHYARGDGLAIPDQVIDGVHWVISRTTVRA